MCAEQRALAVGSSQSVDGTVISDKRRKLTLDIDAADTKSVESLSGIHP
jgi:hypothetical protein